MGGDLCEDILSVGIQGKHQQSLWKQLNELRREGELCDVTFKCAGGEVSAHKCVLASAGDFFKALFLSPISTASSTNVVVFDHFSVETVSLLMDVVYSVVDVAAIHVVELLRLAEYVRLDWLVELLVENIRKHINELNVCNWYDIAECCGAVKLKFLCECFVRENFEKLESKRVEEYFNSEVLSRISLWNNDMKRDVVISADKYLKNIWLLDLTHSNIGKLEGACGRWMKELFSELYLSFLYQNAVYLIARNLVSDERGDSCGLWKWQHVSKSFELIYELKDDDIKDKLTNRCADTNDFYIIQFHYDNVNSLFVLCLMIFDDDLHPFRYCIFKFDMRLLAFYDGHILIENECNNEPCQIASLEGYETCLVTPDHVYFLKWHDFQVPGFLANDLPRIDLSIHVKEEGEDIFEVAWCPWKTVNIKGEFYCLVQNGIFQWYVVLKLDVNNCSWKFCAARLTHTSKSNSYDPELRGFFQCGSRLYASWKEEGGAPQGNIFYLDEKKKSLEPIDFTPDTICEDIYSHIIVPYHIFL